jgi:hypothetical protein
MIALAGTINQQKRRKTMPNKQTAMGIAIAMLLGAVILLAWQAQQRPPTLGESLHEAVQELKK